MLFYIKGSALDEHFVEVYSRYIYWREKQRIKQ